MAQDEVDGDRCDRVTYPGDAPGLEAFNALLRRTLAMLPKPHSEMKLGNPRGRKPKLGTQEDDSRGVQVRR